MTVKVNDWNLQDVGQLDLSAVWRAYPPKPGNFSHPPAIVLDAGRPVLHLATAAEALRIGRPLQVHLTKTPWFVWEWKPLVLPDGADLRDPARNDQAGRVMLVFEGMKGILYVWDTAAPVGTEVRSDPLDFFERVLIVVRSGRNRARSSSWASRVTPTTRTRARRCSLGWHSSRSATERRPPIAGASAAKSDGWAAGRLGTRHLMRRGALPPAPVASAGARAPVHVTGSPPTGRERPRPRARQGGGY
jgi:hypothetical protein